MASSTAFDVDSLSEVIAVGTAFIQGGLSTKMTYGAVALMALWMFMLTIMHLRAIVSNARMLKIVLSSLSEFREQMNVAPQQPADSTFPGQADFAALAQTLQCIDAKLLQMSQENEQVRSFCSELHENKTVQVMEKGINKLMTLADKIHTMVDNWTREVPPKIKEIWTFTSAVPAMQKGLSVFALDTQKAFALHETLSDGILRQGREALQLLQSELRAHSEKLTELKAFAEELKSTCKQTSLDLHVGRTKAEQKQDNVHNDVKATQHTLRGLNPLVPGMKTLTDKIDNALNYHVQANQHDTKVSEEIQNLQESTGNTESRALRLESLLVALQDTVAEVQDACFQVRESQNIVQENLQTVLERTPKLPKRNPPAAEPTASMPPSQSQAQTQQNAPSMQMPTTPPVHPEVSQPIRLSEHLHPQPLLGRDTQQPIYMVQQDPLQRISTADLLRALMARGNF